MIFFLLLFFFLFSIFPEEVKTALLTTEQEHSGHQIGHQQLSLPDDYGFKLTSAATPISASFGGHPIGNTMVDGMMSSAFAAAAAAHQDSLSRMTSMTNSIAPHQGHAAHTAGQILGNFKVITICLKYAILVRLQYFLFTFHSNSQHM